MISYLDYEHIDEINSTDYFKERDIINIETIPDPDRKPFNMYRVWYKEEVKKTEKDKDV